MRNLASRTLQARSIQKRVQVRSIDQKKRTDALCRSKNAHRRALEYGLSKSTCRTPYSRHAKLSILDSPGTVESYVDGIVRSRYLRKVAEDDCKSELLRQTCRHGEMDTEVVVPQVGIERDLLTTGTDQHHIGVLGGSGCEQPQHLSL